MAADFAALRFRSMHSTRWVVQRSYVHGIGVLVESNRRPNAAMNLATNYLSDGVQFADDFKSAHQPASSRRHQGGGSIRRRLGTGSASGAQ